MARETKKAAAARRSAAAKKGAATRKRNAAAKAKAVRNAEPKGKKPPPKKRAAKRKSGGSVASKAKAAGAKGGRLNAAKTALRNALIVQRATADRWTWAMIAEEAGISEKQCRRVVDDVKGSPSPFETTPSDLVEEWALGYRETVSAFTALAANADNTAAAVGALRGANDARDKLIALLQAVGHVPHDLGMLKVQRDVEQIARRMLDAVESMMRGEMTAEQVRDVFYELAGIPQVPQLGPGDGT